MTDFQKISRRELIQKGAKLSLVACGTMMIGKPGFLNAAETQVGNPDLVAVRNGEPDALFKKAIELMGGMEKFVKKGQTVVVKPNLLGPFKPELAATTNPLLVKTICEACYQAGAQKVYIFDNASPSYASVGDCYKITGMEDAAKSSGAVLVPADSLKYYKSVNIPGTTNKLGSVSVHELILNSDVFINVPILKNHTFTYLTAAMKNLMGAVYDRMEYHDKGLDECIADFCLFGKPHLNIVDGYRVKMRGGQQPAKSEKSPDIELKKMILVSKDIVAIDAAATKILGGDPASIQYIKLAHKMKIGNMNLQELKIATHSL